MHLFLQTSQGHDREGKEEAMRDLRAKVKRLVIWIFKLVSKNCFSVLEGIIYPGENLMNWLSLPETY